MNDGLVFTVEPFLSMGAQWATDSHDPWTLLSDPPVLSTVIGVLTTRLPDPRHTTA